MALHRRTIFSSFRWEHPREADTAFYAGLSGSRKVGRSLLPGLVGPHGGPIEWEGRGERSHAGDRGGAALTERDLRGGRTRPGPPAEESQPREGKRPRAGRTLEDGARPPNAPAGTRTTEAPPGWRTILAERQLVRFLTHRRKVAFYSQLHRLVRSGIGLIEAFDTLALSWHGQWGAMAHHARGELERGGTLHEALLPFSHLLERHYVDLVGFGERTGSLEEVLLGIVEDLERQQKLRGKAILPALYLVYLLGAIVFVGPLAEIGPAIHSGSAGAGAGGLAGVLGVYGSGLCRNLLLVALALGLYFLFPVALAALGLETAYDRLRLRNPLTAPLFRNLYASRFFLNLSTAVSAGLGMQQALAWSARASGSAFLRSRVPEMVSSIDSGHGLAPTVARLGVFPDTMIGTLAVSEKAGALDEGLRRLAADAEETTAHWTKIYLVALLALVVALLMGKILLLIFRNLFGPIQDYYDAIRDADV